MIISISISQDQYEWLKSFAKSNDSNFSREIRLYINRLKTAVEKNNNRVVKEDVRYG